MKTKKIKEGDVELYVPKEEGLTKKASVFYNPEMEFDRDLSEIVVSVLRPRKICDCLGASGVRGLRYKSVLAGRVDKGGLAPYSEVVINDKNPKAAELAESNRRLNSLNVRVERKDAKVLLLEEVFDFIDIDPFGSPIYFLDSAAKSIRNNGLISMTATDTGPLSGTSPLTCFRRYGIKSFKTDFSKELGLRILISSAIKNFARYDMAFNPIFSYYKRHYFRVFGQIKKGSGRANKLLERFDYISYCPDCGFRERGILSKCKNCKGEIRLIGPVYLDDFASKEFCDKMLKLQNEENSNSEKISKLVKTVKEEQGFPPYYETHKICKWNKKRLKRMDELLDKLEGKRTHFTPTGLKTKKSFGEVLRVLG